MLAMKTCFKLQEERSNRFFFLFPSLATPSSNFSCLFPIYLFLFIQFLEVIRFVHSNKEGMQMAGLKYSSPEGIVFVSGFFGQFIVEVMNTLKVSYFFLFL